MRQSFMLVDVSVYARKKKIEYLAVIKYLHLKGNAPA